jgi:hypothetical protein
MAGWPATVPMTRPSISPSSKPGLRSLESVTENIDETPSGLLARGTRSTLPRVSGQILPVTSERDINQGATATKNATQAALDGVVLVGLWRIKDRSFVVQHQMHPNELKLFDTTSRMTSNV